MKRYAEVGLGNRSQYYYLALTGEFKHLGKLVGFCDVNQGRMDLVNAYMQSKGCEPARTYKAHDFERMIHETKPDVVIVSSGPDATHSGYIIRAMELGCDVITEKPMTNDESQCVQILEAVKRTGRRVRVGFNYRYSPPRSQVKEILASGAIGEVLSVDFAWMLDTRHGADYFRRWHRQRKNSGSLLVHKATHHFDLVNWWLDDMPREVFCHGSRRYYTPARAEELGLHDRAERCLDCPAKSRCKLALDMRAHADMKRVYLEHEHEDGYFRDRCVFAPEIDIWDSMSVSVEYKRGALLNYILHAYSPYEGYTIAFNGTKGRLEHSACENTYVHGDGSLPGELTKGRVKITLIPEFSSPREIEVRTGVGSHGGGDIELLRNLFESNPPADPLKRAATEMDGANALLIGAAACRSIDRGMPVTIEELLCQEGTSVHEHELAAGK